MNGVFQTVNCILAKVRRFFGQHIHVHAAIAKGQMKQVQQYRYYRYAMFLIRIAFPQNFSNMESLKKLSDFRRNGLFILNVICYTVHGADPFCMAMMWYPVHAINLNLLKVKGRSDLFLRLEVIKKILGVSMLVTTAPFGLVVMCYGTIANSIIALTINTYYTGKLIHVGFVRQMRDLSFTLLLSLTMFAIVYVLTFTTENNYLQLSIGIAVGISYFCGVCLMMKPQEISFVKSIIKKR